jgi:hypothetical protein
MKADELAAPSGNSFKFAEVGDTVEGVIVYVGEWQTQVNKFNGNTEEVTRIGVDTGDGETIYVWPRRGSSMASAMAQALRDAGLSELTEGQKLKLRFDSTKDTGKPMPLKMFRAKITAESADDAARRATVTAAQDDPF